MTTEEERTEWRKASVREDSTSWDQPREYMFLRKLAETAETAMPALLDENAELRREVERLEEIESDSVIRLDERKVWIDELWEDVRRLENDLITAETKIAELEVCGLRWRDDVKREVSVDYLCRAERSEAKVRELEAVIKGGTR